MGLTINLTENDSVELPRGSSSLFFEVKGSFMRSVSSNNLVD